MALTAGLTLACTNARAGGIKTVHFISAADLTSMTYASGSTSNYGTIALASGKKWYAFEFEEDMAEFRETVEGEKGSFIVTQEIELFFPRLDATNSAAIQNLMNESPCGLIGVVTDSNDTKWVVGYNAEFLKERPLRLVSDNSTTNKALNETPGSTVVLRAIATKKARTTTATITV